MKITKQKYICLLCGRDKFDSHTPHICVSGYRKRHIKWATYFITIDTEGK